LSRAALPASSRISAARSGCQLEYEETAGCTELLTLEDSGEVNGGTGTDALGVVAALQMTVDTTDGDWMGQYKENTSKHVWFYSH
jgi:hypothetical protein